VWDDRLHPRQTSTVPASPEPPDRPPARAPREAVQRWRLVLTRARLAGEIGQREQLAAWEQSLSASGLPVAGLDATPPKARFAPAAPLAAAIPGEAELADVWLTERVPAWRARDRIAASLPEGWGLADAYDVWLGAPALPGQVAASVYRATFVPGAVDPHALESAADALLRADALPRERQKGQTTVAYDLRPFLDALAVDGREGCIRMTLRHDPERGIGRPEEVLAALGELLGARLEPASLVRESLVLAPPPPPGAAGPRSRSARQPVMPASRPRR
jgi:radical SAM-linked protein